MVNQNFKFRGGVWIGYYSVTWPFGVLQVSQDQLIIFDELRKKELQFKHDEIEKIELKKYFPVIGYGVHIVSVDKKIEDPLYFWYWSFHFKKLVNALKQFGWL